MEDDEGGRETATMGVGPVSLSGQGEGRYVPRRAVATGGRPEGRRRSSPLTTSPSSSELTSVPLSPPVRPPPVPLLSFTFLFLSV